MVVTRIGNALAMPLERPHCRLWRNHHQPCRESARGLERVRPFLGTAGMTLRQGACRLLTGGLGRTAALGVGFAVAGVATIWAATSTGLAWTLTGVALVLVSPLVGRAFMVGAVMTPTHLKVRRLLTTRTFAKAAPGGGFDWGNGTGRARGRQEREPARCRPRRQPSAGHRSARLTPPSRTGWAGLSLRSSVRLAARQRRRGGRLQ
jgi:hypothetical protein